MLTLISALLCADLLHFCSNSDGTVVSVDRLTG